MPTTKQSGNKESEPAEEFWNKSQRKSFDDILAVLDKDKEHAKALGERTGCWFVRKNLQAILSAQDAGMEDEAIVESLFRGAEINRPVADADTKKLKALIKAEKRREKQEARRKPSGKPAGGGKGASNSAGGNPAQDKGGATSAPGVGDSVPQAAATK